MTNPENPVPVTEPSIWDHFVSRLKFWSRDKEPVEVEEQDLQQPESESEERKSFPWLTVAALVLALIAQLTLEPSPNRTPWPGVVLYAGALGCLVAALVRKEWKLPEPKPDAEGTLSMKVKPQYLLIGTVLAMFAFVLFGNGEFGFFNTLLWVLAMVFIFLAFREKKADRSFSFRKLWDQLKTGGWQIRITRWTLIVLAALAVILFFNYYRLDSVPPEMLSDQAEKLLDINDVLNGARPVYFPRNTGREVIHFYLTAAYMAIFNLDVSFLNLKAVAVFANLVTLLFIYLLGKEVGNKWVGLAAALFAGIAYWPLLFTRLALRIPYYPLFVAPVMYFMIRGLRRQNINDILLTGLFLGLGLHGYTPFRIVPIFVVIGSLIYILHRPARGKRVQALFALLLIAFVSLVVFIPLLRYWLANPQLFAYRAFSRLTGMEVGFQGSPVVIFFRNFWKASIMFFWDNGVIWAHSVPNRPALEVVSGALYFIGIAALLIRYIRKRNWMDLFLLVSIPLMMMPSILSLAYPNENPCLNRTAGAVVPVFVVIGMAFETILRSIRTHTSGKIGKILVTLLVLLLVIWSGANNYDLVFNQYYTLYKAASWNTTELGEVAELFIDTMGTPETTYVVGYPHWVDSRLVAINAGYAGRDFAILPENIPATVDIPGAKLFFVNVNDGENMKFLQEIYPDGILSQVDSSVANKDFMTFFVPPTQGVTP
ncbi:MAG: glycosyltransferase family 39 protein [Anaerolineaceae bacterium]|nr:glycosyltransferase family 39 protein [Anaerolineaceae bacterium]